MNTYDIDILLINVNNILLSNVIQQITVISWVLEITLDAKKTAVKY